MMQVNNDEKPSPSSTHTFNRAAERTIADAMAISNQRAGEYHDSWSLQNLKTPFIDNLLRDYPVCPVNQDEREYKRLVVMASMVDIKVSRMGGGWKKDTSIDMINYVAAYCELREQFGRNAPKEPSRTSGDTYQKGPVSWNGAQSTAPFITEGQVGYVPSAISRSR